MRDRMRASKLDRVVLQGFASQFFASVRTRARMVSSRLERATSREKLLLGGLVLGALAYGPIAAMDYRTAQEEAYVDAVTERASAQLESRAARRISAAAADTNAIRDMRGWGFQATNSAVAQVLIERRLLEAATDANLARLKMTVDPAIETRGPTRWMSARVEADLVWRGVFAFMDNLAAWPEGFQVTSFGYEVRPIPPGLEGMDIQLSPGTVRIGLAFPVEVEEEVEASSAQSAGQPQVTREPVSNGMFDTGPAR
jgi:hypothetical protein